MNDSDWLQSGQMARNPRVYGYPDEPGWPDPDPYTTLFEGVTFPPAEPTTQSHQCPPQAADPLSTPFQYFKAPTRARPTVDNGDARSWLDLGDQGIGVPQRSDSPRTDDRLRQEIEYLKQKYTELEVKMKQNNETVSAYIQELKAIMEKFIKSNARPQGREYNTQDTWMGGNEEESKECCKEGE
ncbi:uncharacterized protein BP5553_10482 [Venustampulla echinocandica]|uniref:Uncharacterized protein n=1 Tax=Venustampulla echinocandica TaxID=2656787 RepID=A0A370T9F9_9HELO|nr:uncharacterized protein BP5553_10482 [Venustampulla echinocandica]RDL30204.1 hypothetical protein BP5553_10482 [Venustampulla echinocandica]